MYQYSKLVDFFLIFAKLHFRIHRWNSPSRPCISAIGYLLKKILEVVYNVLHIIKSKLLFIVLSFSEVIKQHSCWYGLAIMSFMTFHQLPLQSFFLRSLEFLFKMLLISNMKCMSFLLYLSLYLSQESLEILVKLTFLKFHSFIHLTNENKSTTQKIKSLCIISIIY